MTKEHVENVKKMETDNVIPEDTVIFVSTEEDEQQGNFEFLCCRGGTMNSGGGGLGGRW